MFKVERKIFHIMNQDMYNHSSESTKECINTHYQTRDTVFSIIVSVAFILIITFLSYFDNGTESDFSQIIKVINWREIAPLFILSLTIGLINYIVRLIKKVVAKQLLYVLLLQMFFRLSLLILLQSNLISGILII